MKPYFLNVAYVGSGFFGWQFQTNVRSVQNELWRAAIALDSHAPMPAGTSRTDSGVHAKAQGVLVRLNKEWDQYRLLTALNAHLPWDIRIMSAQRAPENFFPRAHAVAKRYIYRIHEGTSKDPFLHQRQWHIFGSSPLNRDAMKTAASYLVGTHDFSSFRNHECAAISTHRTLYQVKLEEDRDVFNISFEGDRFLMHMVRIITGTLVEVGKGRLLASDIPTIITAKDRCKAGITAPPHGLYLEKIWYQKRWNIGDNSPWPELVHTQTEGADQANN
jgi:tRNA pseudouridine38-40 synthase